MYNQANGSDRR